MKLGHRVHDASGTLECSPFINVEPPDGCFILVPFETRHFGALIQQINRMTDVKTCKLRLRKWENEMDCPQTG